MQRSSVIPDVLQGFLARSAAEFAERACAKRYLTGSLSIFRTAREIRAVFYVSKCVPAEYNDSGGDNMSECSCASSDSYFWKYREILSNMIKHMTEAKLTDSISQNFIVQMLPHHWAAIEMSETVLKYTKNRALRYIAENIISEQTKSIEDMEKILASCSEKTNNSRELALYREKTGDIIDTMFREMNNAYFDSNVTCDFIREMIPHHMGAVKMSQNALRFPVCKGLVPILDAIIKSQEKGIRQMETLKKKLECKD